MAAAIADGKRVVHLSAHSFAPVLDGETRRADIALLVRPVAASTKPRSCNTWLADAAAEALPTLDRPPQLIRIAATADGLTTSLSRMHRADRYVGIEMEVNQRLLDGWRTR